MKFVEKHLTQHHLFHAPHKWFFALIGSPIHFAEMHYKKRYHLTYVHAKKLFLFDMALLGSIIVLIGITFFWFIYDPTVVDDVDMFIQTNKEKIVSGDYVSYTILYKNTSNSLLKSPVLTLVHPNGFIVEDVEPENQFDKNSETFLLSDLSPHAEGSVTIGGHFYAEPETEKRIQARMSFTQEERNRKETKQVAVITTLRGSIIGAQIDMPERIIAKSTIPFSIKITAPKQKNMQEIRVPLQSGYITPNSYNKPSVGYVENGEWVIPLETSTDDSNTKDIAASINGVLKTEIPDGSDNVAFSIKPTLQIKGERIPQQTYTKNLQVVHPKISLSAEWDGAVNSVRPGTVQTMIVHIQNTGSVDLTDLALKIAIPSSIVQTTNLVQKNIGSFEQNILTISGKHNAALQNLTTGETKQVQIAIPLRQYIAEGEDIVLGLAPNITARVNGIDTITFSSETSAPGLKIGTDLGLAASIRYYTDEGDQLGRGPLPPTPDKQTTYWALIHIQNTTSDLQNVEMTARLTPHATWGNKSSVSIGSPITYNEKTHTITWRAAVLDANTNSGVYMALNFTPTNADIGTTPALLENIYIKGYDTHTKETVAINQSTGLDISMPSDKEALKHGVTVQ